MNTPNACIGYNCAFCGSPSDLHPLPDHRGIDGGSPGVACRSCLVEMDYLARNIIYENHDQTRHTVEVICVECGNRFMAITDKAALCPPCRKLSNGKNTGGAANKGKKKRKKK